MNGNVINLVGVSGGKDSTALMLWAKYESGYPDHSLRFTFCDTGNEAEETYAHVRMLSDKIHCVEWIKPPLGFYELAQKKGRFPSARARFCTTELKMLPTKRWIAARQAEGFTVITHSGVRAVESDNRSTLAARVNAEESFFDCEEYRPLLRWTIADIWAIHEKYGIPPNPLYALGAQRVGCFPCVMSRKSEIRTINKFQPARFDMIREKEYNCGKESRGGFTSFFARNKVPLRYRTKIIQAPVQGVPQAGRLTPGLWNTLGTDEAQGWLELHFADDYAEIVFASPSVQAEVLMQDMAVATIDDVIRWATSENAETGEFEFDDLPEALACGSGMCE